METQANMPAQRELIYLLLDISMGNRDGARRPVEEVLVWVDLTRLHRTTCTAQLLYRKQRQ